MKVLKSDIHGSNSNVDLFESGQQVVEVVRGEGELGRFEVMGGE